MSGRTIRWAIAFLIGLATVTATGYGWRAAQIGSTAAFDDRQSISESVRMQQLAVQRAVEVSADVREYRRYRADYRVAAALDARARHARAAALRADATRRAAAAGVFGRFAIGAELLDPSPQPRPFDVDARTRALAAEQATGLSSPPLHPGHWAARATAIRVRVNHLTRWAFVVVVAVLLYTIAEVSTRREALYGFTAAGVVVYLVGLAGGLASVF